MKTRRITKGQIESRIKELNHILKRPCDPWTRSDGENVANVGNFHLSQAYGGYELQEMSNDRGAVYYTFRSGHIPARDLYNRINALIEGISLGWEGITR